MRPGTGRKIGRRPSSALPRFSTRKVTDRRDIPLLWCPDPLVHRPVHHRPGRVHLRRQLSAPPPGYPRTPARLHRAARSPCRRPQDRDHRAQGRPRRDLRHNTGLHCHTAPSPTGATAPALPPESARFRTAQRSALGSLLCLASARRTSSSALVKSCTTWNQSTVMAALSKLSPMAAMNAPLMSQTTSTMRPGEPPCVARNPLNFARLPAPASRAPEARPPVRTGSLASGARDAGAGSRPYHGDHRPAAVAHRFLHYVGQAVSTPGPSPGSPPSVSTRPRPSGATPT